MSFLKKNSRKSASKAGRPEPCTNGDNSRTKQHRRTLPKPIPGVKIRAADSMFDLSCDPQTQTCKCAILQPEPSLPKLPHKADPVLIPASSELNVYILRTPENIYRLIAKRQDSDEEFLNIALNCAKYVIKSDTWHEIELTQCGRKKTIVLNFKNSSKTREENFHSFFNDLLNILHSQRALARVAVFYPAGYHYAGTPTEEVIKKEPLPVDLKPVKKMENAALSPEDVLNNLSKLAESLEGGDVEEAKYRAATLARQRVKVHFEVLNPLTSNVEKEFSVKVCVEDRDSSGGAITLMVRQTDTVACLKQRIERVYGFPQAIQKWIIGQRIPRDEDVLKNCGVKGPGCTLFLYLVSSRSVGLTKEVFMQAQAASGDVRTLDSEDDQNGYISMDHFMRGIGAGAGSVPGGPVATSQTRPRPRPPPRPQQLSTGGSQRAKAPPLPSTPPPPLSFSIPQGAVAYPEPTNRPHAMAESVQKPRQVAVEIALGQSSGASAPDIPSTETEGWICPTCTYINLPTRPGCEMCSESRPVDYKVPENFRVPEEEEARLQRERQLDLQAQDADINGQRRRRDSGTDNDTSLSPRHLDELLRLNDSLHASVQLRPDHSPAYHANVFGSFASPVPESVPTEHSESDDENT